MNALFALTYPNRNHIISALRNSFPRFISDQGHSRP